MKLTKIPDDLPTEPKAAYQRGWDDGWDDGWNAAIDAMQSHLKSATPKPKRRPKARPNPFVRQEPPGRVGRKAPPNAGSAAGGMG